MRLCTLAEAIGDHLRPGDAIHVAMGHSRWTALLRELVRQYWHRPAGFTLQLASLSSLGAVLFRAGCFERVVTVYSGDSFPSFTPNPVFQEAYASGRIQVENWSFLTYLQRLRAAASGLPAMVTGSVAGSSMEENSAFHRVETELGTVCLVEPLVPDIAVLHAAVADRHGNLAIAAPFFDGVIGAMAARRGVLATVDRVVDDLRPWSAMVRIPASRVLAVVEAPFGAHPGGVFAGTSGAQLPIEGYAEDIPYWIEARNVSRSTEFDRWIEKWFLEPEDHAAYLSLLGQGRLDDLAANRAGSTTKPVRRPREHQVLARERAAAWFADLLAERIGAVDATGVLAGAGLANLAAWVGTQRAQHSGHEVSLVAELGMFGYDPVDGDPLVFSFDNFPTAVMLQDTEQALGILVNGATMTSIACVGAAQVDRTGNLNSTMIPGGPYLVGSGGANDVVTNAAETLVITTMSSRVMVDRCGYVTCPGTRVRAVVTDLGILTKVDGELTLTHVPGPAGEIDAAIARARAACGWDLAVADSVQVLREVTLDDAHELRRFDTEGTFLGRPKGDG